MMILIAVGIAAAVVVIIVLWYIRTGNNFERAQIKIEEARSGIEVALTKRYDTLTKLLDVTKGYMKHEQETLMQVIRMRSGMTANELTEANRKMNEVAQQIQLAVEAYPELRSSEMFSNLQHGIADVEEHLQAARRLYNSNVTRFNTMKAVFPSSIIGRRYDSFEFFQAEEHKRADVQMKFNG